MGAFKYIPKHEVDARHRASTGAASPPRPPAARDPGTPVNRNVTAVLSLGDTRYYQVLGRVYCIPPIPFKTGQRILDAQTRCLAAATRAATLGSKEDITAYFAGLGELARLLWKHMRPTGRVRRIMRRLHMLRNPFVRCSEKDIQTLTDFFLQGRTKSSVRAISEAER